VQGAKSGRALITRWRASNRARAFLSAVRAAENVEEEEEGKVVDVVVVVVVEIEDEVDAEVDKVDAEVVGVEVVSNSLLSSVRTAFSIPA